MKLKMARFGSGKSPAVSGICATKIRSSGGGKCWIMMLHDALKTNTMFEKIATVSKDNTGVRRCAAGPASLPDPRTHRRTFWQKAFRQHHRCRPARMTMSPGTEQDAVP